jgi:mersacidin/lichenicidin family type 2 lantibiotic
MRHRTNDDALPPRDPEGKLREEHQTQGKEIIVSNLNIIRAWKDEEYRLSLSEAERAALPGHPAGRLELPDAALDGAAAGKGTTIWSGLYDCSTWT